jgi:hypothetical protein
MRFRKINMHTVSIVLAFIVKENTMANMKGLRIDLMKNAKVKKSCTI